MDSNKTILKELQKIPNIGPAMAGDLVMLGITKVEDLKGRDADDLYDKLSSLTSSRQDPCVADTLESAIHYADTGDGQPWWNFTKGRKERWKNKGR